MNDLDYIPEDIRDYYEEEMRRRRQPTVQQPAAVSSSSFDFIPEDIRPYYEEQARQNPARYAPSQDAPPESVSEYLDRRAVPFYSSINSFLEARNYGQARERTAAGQPQFGDQDIIGPYEMRQRREEQRSTPEAILSGIAHVPALIGEAVIGGAVIGRALPAVAAAPRLLSFGGQQFASAGTFGLSAANVAAQTAMMPSMWLSQSAERAARNGGEWYEPQNIGPAAVMGLSQVAVLGSLGGFANNMPGAGAVPFLQRLATRTAVGMGEQQVIDAVYGTVDQVLPERWQMGTHGGILGLALQGKWGEAAKHAAVQAAVFATFSALHPIMHGEEANRPKPEVPVTEEAPPAPIPSQEPMGPRLLEHTARMNERGQPIITEPSNRPDRVAGLLTYEPPPFRREGPIITEPPPTPPRALLAGPERRPLAITHDPMAMSPDRGRGRGAYTVDTPATEVLTAANKAIAELVKRGMSYRDAVKKVGNVVEPLVEATKANDNITQAEAAKIVERMKLKGPLKELSEKLVEKLPESPPKPSKVEKAPTVAEVRPEAVNVTPERIMPPGKPIEVPIGATKPAELGGKLGRSVAEAPKQETIAEARVRLEPQSRDTQSYLKAKENLDAGRGTAIDRSRVNRFEKGLAITRGRKEGSLRDIAEREGVSHEAVRQRPEVQQAQQEAEIIKAGERELLGKQKGGERIATEPFEQESAAEQRVRDLRDLWAKEGKTPEEVASLTRDLEVEQEQSQRVVEENHAEYLRIETEKGVSRGKAQSALDEALEQYRKEFPHLFDAEVAQAQRVPEPPDAGRAAAPDSGVSAGKPAEGTTAPRANITNRPTPRSGSLNIEPLRDVARFGKSVIDRVNEIVRNFAIADAAKPKIGAKGYGRRGEINMEPIRELGNKLLKAYENGVDELSKLAGASFPVMTRINRAMGEAASYFVANPKWSALAAPDVIDAIRGKATSEQMVKNLTAHGELVRIASKENNLAAAKSALASGHKTRAAEYQAHADAITSFIGNEGSPFKTDAEFSAWKNSAEFHRYFKAYELNQSPWMKKLYAKYKDINEADILDEIMNQLPDHPFNFLRLDPDNPVVASRLRPGDLANLRQRKLQYDQVGERALPWEAYDWNVENVITSSLSKLAKTATKAQYHRAVIEAGMGKRGPSGQRVTLENGDSTYEMTNAFGGRDSLYVSEKIEPEFRQSHATDHRLNLPLITAASSAFNKLALMSTTEAVYHIKNQMTSMTSPGVFPIWDHLHQAARLWEGSKEVKADILRLAEIDATKTPHLESGMMWGGEKSSEFIGKTLGVDPKSVMKTDPTYWLSKFIHFTDMAARLAVKAGHERNVRWGRVEDTATNLRDAANMSLGNYSRESQHKLVAWLRDLGLGPFATAGTTFYMQGLRALGVGPHVQAKSTAHAIGMRAEVIAKAAMFLGFAFAINKSLWNNIFGDDDTPFGAVKTGKTADGKTTYFDLTNFTGLTRGMRQTGLLAVTEGYRHGTSAARIGDQAAQSVYTSLLHPAEGPIVNFAHTLATGRNTIGMNLARNPPPSGSHALENLQAAGIHANPILGTFLSHDRRHEDMAFGQKAMELIGPFNPFKQRGDQVLAEMHGRLREVEDARKVFAAQPGNLGRAFPHEREYDVLRAFDRKIKELEDVMKGQARTSGGRVQLTKPEAERVKQLRQQISQLARRALEVSAAR